MNCRMIFAVSALALIFGAAGCSDDLTEATALRAAFVNTGVTIHDTTITLSASSTFRKRLGTNGRQNQLGRSGGYEASTLLKFISASFPQRDTVNVISARLTLRLEGWFGDSTGVLAFTVHKITGDWLAPYVRWDSLPSYDAAVRGSFSGPATSDTQSVTIDLDTAMVRDWLRPSTVTQYGIMLIPAAGCTMIRGVHVFEYDSVSFYPTLRIIARNTAGTVQDTSTFDAGVDTFVGNVDNPVAAPDRFFTQSGVAFRSRLLFDVSFIPRGAVINSAELTLVRDPATSRLNRFIPDSTLLLGTLTSATDSSAVDAVIAGATRSGALADTFRFPLRRPVQLWLVGNNHGLLLRNSTVSETSSFALFSFYNEHATDDRVRPKLRIRYAVERKEATP